MGECSYQKGGERCRAAGTNLYHLFLYRVPDLIALLLSEVQLGLMVGPAGIDPIQHCINVVIIRARLARLRQIYEVI